MYLSKVLNIAHRGASAYEPENTLRAVRRALELGANGVEIDIASASRDGYLIVMHDKAVDRTTDGTGYVRDMTLEELKKLDAGKGERIPTLDEVMEVVRGRAKLLIDVKDRPRIEEKLVKAIQENGMEEGVIVTSSTHANVRRVKELNPQIKTAVLLSGRKPLPENPVQLAFRYNADMIHVGDYRQLTRKLIQEAHRHGLAVLVGTTEDPEELKKLVKMNVDGITTNDPGVLSDQEV